MPKARINQKDIGNLKPYANSPINSFIYVDPGIYMGSTNTSVKFAGGNSPSFSPVITNGYSRVDVLVLTSGATLSVVIGTEGNPGVTPTYPGNSMPLCEVFINQLSTVTVNNNMIFDVRPVLSLGGGLPGGVDTQIQFNDGGSLFNGSSNLTFNKISGITSVSNMSVSVTATINYISAAGLRMENSINADNIASFGSPNHNAHVAIEIYNADGQVSAFVAGATNEYIVGTGSGDSGFRYELGHQFFIGTTYLATLVVNANGIGIFNTNPTYFLEIGSDGAAEGIVCFRNHQGANYRGNIYSDATYGGLRLDTYANIRPIFIDGSQVILASTGNKMVGISTSTPTATLHVNGNMYVATNGQIDGTLTISGLLSVPTSLTVNYININSGIINNTLTIGNLSVTTTATINYVKVTNNISIGNNLVLAIIPSATQTSSGMLITATATTTMSFGDVGFVAIDGTIKISKADVAANANAYVMCADSSIVPGSVGNFLYNGVARNDSWSWTIGGKLYLSITGTNGNTLTQTAPVSSGNIVQIVGVATATTRIIFNPDLSQVELT